MKYTLSFCALLVVLLPSLTISSPVQVRQVPRSPEGALEREANPQPTEERKKDPSLPEENEVVIPSTDFNPMTGFGDGIFLTIDPLHGMRDMFEGFRRIEDMMRNVQNRLWNFTARLPTTFDNRTQEVVEIDGRRYKLERSILRQGDNNTSVFVSATSLIPDQDDRNKREALGVSSGRIYEGPLGVKRSKRDSGDSESESDSSEADDP